MFHTDPARKLSASLYDIYHCCVYREKRLVMKRVNLVGFIIRIYHQFRPDPARKLSANLYDIYHCCVFSEKLLSTEELSETCRVLFQK